MIGKVTAYSVEKKDVFEPLIDKGPYRLNHVVIEPGKFFPKHPTDAEVTIIVVSGQLTISLGDEDPVVFVRGQVIEAPKGVESVLGNASEEYTEVFVIKS